jgi:hypothetical protein
MVTLLTKSRQNAIFKTQLQLFFDETAAASVKASVEPGCQFLYSDVTELRRLPTQPTTWLLRFSRLRLRDTAAAAAAARPHVS